MLQNNDRAARIVAEAEQLINTIQGQLKDGEEFFRARGIERDSLSARLSPQDKAEVDRLLAQDMAAIEREVAEEKARLSFSTEAGNNPPKKNRTMI